MKLFQKKNKEKKTEMAAIKGSRRSVSEICMALFYFFFALCFSWLIVHVIVNGYYNYHEVILLFLILCDLCLLLLFWELIKRHEGVLGKYREAITIGFLGFMFIIQIIMGLKLRYKPVWDIDAIYSGAIEWAETGTFSSYYEYFSYFFNNFGGLYIYSRIFRIVHMLGGKDYFMAATMVNCLLSLSTMYVTGAAAGKLMGIKGRMMVYMLFLLSMPFYFIAPAFYTDALSMLFPVLIYWLYLLAKEQKKLWLRFLLYILIGFAAALGISIKPTVAIACIAVLIDAAFHWNWKRSVCMTLVATLILVPGLTGLNYSVYKHLDRAEAEQNRTPILHWVMMGLSDTGMYNNKDYKFTRSFEDPDERSDALKEEIKNRIRKLGAGGLVRLFTKKGDICFGDGTYGLSDFLIGKDEEDTWLRRLVVKGGAYYEYYSHICTGLLLALYILMIISGLQELFVLKSKTFRALAPRLAVFGLLLFLICWEARWRYFSNFIPMIFLSALLGLERFERIVDMVRKRLQLVWSGTSTHQ